MDLGDSHDLSCQEAQAADTGPIEPRPGRPRGKSKTPNIPGFHSFDEEARQAGLTPASLMRLVRQQRYPAPADISRHKMYPDGHAEKVAAQRFEQRNTQRPDPPPRRGRPRR